MRVKKKMPNRPERYCVHCLTRADYNHFDEDGLMYTCFTCHNSVFVGALLSKTGLEQRLQDIKTIEEGVEKRENGEKKED